MTAKRLLLEVAVASVEDALVADASGADRLELNVALGLGGLTPTPGLLAEVKARTGLPVVAMLRPRGSGFAYAPAELKVMRRDLEWLVEAGADGIAFGALTPDRRIDLKGCRELVAAMAGRVPVFHRAFDLVEAPFEALEALIDLGVRRVMTSGQRESALEGADLIRGLRERAAGRIEVLPAGGVRAHNAAQIVALTGCDQVHAAPRKNQDDPTTSGPSPFGPSFEATDPEKVAAIRRALDATD